MEIEKLDKLFEKMVNDFINVQEYYYDNYYIDPCTQTRKSLLNKIHKFESSKNYFKKRLRDSIHKRKEPTK